MNALTPATQAFIPHFQEKLNKTEVKLSAAKKSNAKPKPKDASKILQDSVKVLKWLQKHLNENGEPKDTKYNPPNSLVRKSIDVAVGCSEHTPSTPRGGDNLKRQ